MPAMTHRERVVKALSHEEPDRVPRDLGQGPASSVHIVTYKGLLEQLGIEDEAADASVDLRGQMARACEAVLQRFDIDCRSVALGKPEVVPEEIISDYAYKDEWGVVWVRPEDGHFINGRGPFQDKEPTLAEVEKYRWPEPRDPGRIRGLKERVLKIRNETDYAVVIGLPYSIVRECQRVRGFGEWMEDLVLRF